MIVTLRNWWGAVADLYAGSSEVRFQEKNPDFLTGNPDFLLKNVAFIIKQSLFGEEILPRGIRHPESSAVLYCAIPR